MYATERQQIIATLVADVGRVSVVDLSERFDVTTETVRRDLAALETSGHVRRVHGGAVALDRASTREPSLSERREQHGGAKTAVGRAAMRAFGEAFRGSVYLDAGTTTAAVATELARRSDASDLDVVTHSLAIANDLAAATLGSLTVIGGRVRGLTVAAVGADTVHAIESLRPDIAIIGTNGISAEFGLSTPDGDEAAVKRAIVRSARRVIVVADADKFDRELLVGFAALDDIDVLVTDEAPTGELAAALAAAAVEVWVA